MDWSYLNLKSIPAKVCYGGLQLFVDAFTKHGKGKHEHGHEHGENMNIDAKVLRP